MASIKLPRAPQTDDELDLLIQAFWGIKLPRTAICEGHVAPFDAVSHAFFGRAPGYAVWYASRGSGKSLALAVLGLTKTLVTDIDCTILGGSMAQSQNVREHMAKLLIKKNAPLYAIRKDTATQIVTTTGKYLRPLPASQTSARGPHPPLSLLDEVDEMERAVYDATMGQAMEQINTRGEIIEEYIVASSTWQNPDGTFTAIMEEAREKGLPIFTWCWRELLQANGGWMSERFINQKRKAVTKEMWRTEYDLNEPSGAARAIDLDKVEEFFVDPYVLPLVDHITHGESDEEWVFEKPQKEGLYAAGADWAQVRDKTVITVIRYDCEPRRLVYIRRMNRAPYPVMIGHFDIAVRRYNATAKHDSTGLGRVVHDVSEMTGFDQVQGFDFSARRKRSQMLLGYIADFEYGGYRLPKIVTDFYRAHRNATVDDVYGTHKQGGHLPDDVASMALAHLAAGRCAPASENVGAVPKEGNSYGHKDDQFNVDALGVQQRLAGDVEIVDDRYNDVGVFWLPMDEPVGGSA